MSRSARCSAIVHCGGEKVGGAVSAVNRAATKRHVATAKNVVRSSGKMRTPCSLRMVYVVGARLKGANVVSRR